MYVEGGDFGYSNSTSPLFPYFGCAFNGDGNDSATGNVQSLTGVAGTIAQGLSYGYPYRRAPDSWVDIISANGGTIFLRDQSGNGRAVYHTGLNDAYHTVFSAVTFGALRNTDSNRQALMQTIVNFLNGLGIEETNPQPAPTAQRLTVSPNPASGRLSFACRTCNNARLEVLDATGKAIARWQVSAGAQSINWNGIDLSGNRVVPGCYLARLTEVGRTTTARFTITR